MLRFKAFRGADLAAVEKQINSWLMQAEPDVKMMDQGIATAGEVIVSFLYDEGFRASERRLTEEAGTIVEHALKEHLILEPLKINQDEV